MAVRSPTRHGFADRDDAGVRLAELCAEAAPVDAVVLGLPRGGVPVAAHVAAALHAPLDVLAVRKIGAPGNPEFGLGAVAEGGAAIVDDASAEALGIDAAALRAAVEAARADLAAAGGRYRSGAPLPLAGRTAVLVDDGVATGGTMRAAVRAARDRGAARVVVAVPVAAVDALAALRREADQVVCAIPADDLRAVGWWYMDFDPVPDRVVRELLAGGGPAGPIAESVLVPAGDVGLEADLAIPVAATGLVVFAHGSGSSRRSPRNRQVAERLRGAGVGTLLLDLLTPDEAEHRSRVFDIQLLARRLRHAIDWAEADPRTRMLPIGLFGASTGAGAALVAAAERPGAVRAVVARGGRPDLAEGALPRVAAPVLLMVGGDDREVLELNEAARARLTCPSELVVIPGATHLFEEPGALEAVADRAAQWFADRLR